MQTLSAPSAPTAARPPAVVYRLASDARLARLAAAGREGAMAAIFERHHQALHRYCYSILGNGHDAADALQNAMVKALGSLPGETREIALKPWLYRIAHNEAISLLRARRSDTDLDAAAHIGDRAAARTNESRERLRALTQDVGELTERQRSSLLMRELGGLEFAEVAEALSTSASAVKQSVYEARCALRAMEEGRAMDCDAVRRAISDGDRRTLRGMKLRGHLRACDGCRAFELALHARPAQLNAMIPPLPLAAGAAMLHGIIGGGGGTGGGGLLAGLMGTAKVGTGISLGAKAAAVAALSVAVAGGAVYAVPEIRQSAADDAPARTLSAPAAGTPAPQSNVVVSDGTADADATVAQSAGPTRAAADKASVPERFGSTGARGTAPARDPQPAAAVARRPASGGSRKAAATSPRRAATTQAHSRRSTARKPATTPAVVNAAPVDAPGVGTAAGAPAVAKPDAPLVTPPTTPVVTPGPASAPELRPGAGARP